jgi:hypothetical protein
VDGWADGRTGGQAGGQADGIGGVAVAVAVAFCWSTRECSLNKRHAARNGRISQKHASGMAEKSWLEKHRAGNEQCFDCCSDCSVFELVVGCSEHLNTRSVAYLVPNNWLSPGCRYLILGTWYQVLVPVACYLVPCN